MFTMWPYWPTLKQLNPLPRGHEFHHSGRSLHGNHIHVISLNPTLPPLWSYAFTRPIEFYTSGMKFRFYLKFNIGLLDEIIDCDCSL